MYEKIENEGIKQLLLPIKEKVIHDLVQFMNDAPSRLVHNDIELIVVNFIHDLPFTFDYVVLPDNSIVGDKHIKPYTYNIDFSDLKDSTITESNISNHLLEYEGIEPDDDIIYDWTSEWESDHKEVEYNFISDCWIEAKKRSNSKMRAVIYEHECWSNSYELDDKIFLNQAEHFEHLKKKGIPIKTYK